MAFFTFKPPIKFIDGAFARLTSLGGWLSGFHNQALFGKARVINGGAAVKNSAVLNDAVVDNSTISSGVIIQGNASVKNLDRVLKHSGSGTIIVSGNTAVTSEE